MLEVKVSSFAGFIIKSEKLKHKDTIYIKQVTKTQDNLIIDSFITKIKDNTKSDIYVKFDYKKEKARMVMQISHGQIEISGFCVVTFIDTILLHTTAVVPLEKALKAAYMYPKHAFEHLESLFS